MGRELGEDTTDDWVNDVVVLVLLKPMPRAPRFKVKHKQDTTVSSDLSAIVFIRLHYTAETGV